MEGTSRELPGTAAWNFQNGLSGFPSFRENPCSLSCGCQTPLKTTFWLAWDSLGVGVVVFCFKIVCSGNDPILRNMFFRWVVSSPPRCFFRANPFKSHEMSCLSPITSYEIKSPSESGNKCLYINLFQPFLF